MPSTTPERRERIARWFGKDAADYEVREKLISMGFYETTGGMIHPPVSHASLTWEQWEMVIYLVEEWDYGFQTPGHGG
jgi:hypothetical protein